MQLIWNHYHATSGSDSFNEFKTGDSFRLEAEYSYSDALLCNFFFFFFFFFISALVFAFQSDLDLCFLTSQQCDDRVGEVLLITHLLLCS